MSTSFTLVDVVTSGAIQHCTRRASASVRAQSVGADGFQGARKNSSTTLVDVNASNIAVSWLANARKRADYIDAIPCRPARRADGALIDVDTIIANAGETGGAVANK